MIKKGKMPITGTNTAMKAKAPVRATGSNAFPDAQKQVTQPPQPFANPKGTVHAPVKAPMYDSDKLVSNKVGAKALPGGAAVGQTKPINHSGNVFGRFGTTHPKRSGAQNIGKSRKNAAFFGE